MQKVLFSLSFPLPFFLCYLPLSFPFLQICQLSYSANLRFLLERYAKYGNFNNVPVTKHGAQTSGAKRPKINAPLYTAYWSKSMAEYDG